MSTTDTTLVSAEQARADLLTCLNDVRRDANAIDNKAEAIDYALQAAIPLIDTAIETVDGKPHSVTQDLVRHVTESWAEKLES